MDLKTLTYDEAQLHNTAVALGKFQGLHRGHILLIDKIKELAKNNGLTSAVFTINMNNSKMINDSLDKKSILQDLDVDAHIECDFTPEFASKKPYDFIKEVLFTKLGAKYIVVGTDFCFGCNREGNVNTLIEYEEEFGYKVIPIDKLSIDGNIVSSSIIRSFLQEGNVSEALKYMGRPYFIQGRVLQGKKLGRTIDFPTANIIPSESKLLPPFGAYETEVIIDGIRYKAITNIGDNPTVSDDNNITVETHIIDYNNDLYNKYITIYFKGFIREQKRFKDVSELRQQLLKDKASVMHQ